MYKIGDKVETPLGIGKLADRSQNNETKYKVMYGAKSTWYAHDEITPYRTAHEKLLALGFQYAQREDYKRYIHDELGSLIVWDDKTFTTSDCDLEIARIMVQYLEELNNETHTST